MAKGRNSLSYSPSYKVYTAILTQSGTNNPVVVKELKNTIGSISWTRSTQGDYKTDFVFNENTVIFSQGSDIMNNIYPYIDNDDFGNTYKAIISTRITSTNSSSDGLLFNTMIEIRVYE